MVGLGSTGRCAGRARSLEHPRAPARRSMAASPRCLNPSPPKPLQHGALLNPTLQPAARNRAWRAHCLPPSARHTTPAPAQPAATAHQPATAPPRTPDIPPSHPHTHTHLNANGSASTISRRTLLGASTAAAVAAATGVGSLLVLPPASAAAVSGRPSPALGFESRVTEFTLSNGLHFIVLPRGNAPVVSCHTYANVGAWNEATGATGLAHLLEHMAFKGTPHVGTSDFKTEAPLLDALDEAFYELQPLLYALDEAFYELQEAKRGGGDGSTRVSSLRARLRRLQDDAEALTVPNEYGALLQREGAVGLNATTSHDQTRYFVSLPSNKLELWMALEAERFRAPVFRQLYSEKTVIEEERRLRVDNSPLGRYQQEFALRSLANNYRRPVIGFEQDFDALGRREVQAFFDRYYGPANLTIAIVGDADPRVVQRLAERYWGDWEGPAGYTVLARAGAGAGAGLAGDGAGLQRAAALVGAEEDPRPEVVLSGSAGDAVLRAPARSGPAAMLGYYRPPLTSYEGVVLEVLSDVLAGSRTSRLVSDLVLMGQLLSASVVVGYPGERYPGMALVYGVPRDGDTPEAAAALLQRQLAALCDGGVTVSELGRVQRATRAGLLASAQSNSAMASALASYHVLTGSWRGLLDELDIVTSLTPDDLRGVAQRVFAAPNNCFTGYILKA